MKPDLLSSSCVFEPQDRSCRCWYQVCVWKQIVRQMFSLVQTLTGDARWYEALNWLPRRCQLRRTCSVFVPETSLSCRLWVLLKLTVIWRHQFSSTRFGCWDESACRIHSKALRHFRLWRWQVRSITVDLFEVHLFFIYTQHPVIRTITL